MGSGSHHAAERNGWGQSREIVGTHRGGASVLRIGTSSLEDFKSLGRERDFGKGSSYSCMSFFIRRYVPGIYRLIGVIIVGGEGVLELPATIAADDIIEKSSVRLRVGRKGRCRHRWAWRQGLYLDLGACLLMHDSGWRRRSYVCRT